MFLPMDYGHANTWEGTIYHLQHIRNELSFINDRDTQNLLNFEQGKNKTYCVSCKKNCIKFVEESSEFRSYK